MENKDFFILSPLQPVFSVVSFLFSVSSPQLQMDLYFQSSLFPELSLLSFFLHFADIIILKVLSKGEAPSLHCPSGPSCCGVSFKDRSQGPAAGTWTARSSMSLHCPENMAHPEPEAVADSRAAAAVVLVTKPCRVTTAPTGS